MANKPAPKKVVKVVLKAKPKTTPLKIRSMKKVGTLLW